MRSLLFILAVVAGGYAIMSWIVGFLTDAGLSIAVALTAWLIAYIIDHLQRERMRRGRERVWERREREQAAVTRSQTRVGEA